MEATSLFLALGAGSYDGHRQFGKCLGGILSGRNAAGMLMSSIGERNEYCNDDQKLRGRPIVMRTRLIL